MDWVIANEPLMKLIHDFSTGNDLEFSDHAELKIAMNIKFQPFLEHSNKTTNSNPN